MSGDLTIGFQKDDRFDVFAKIRDPQGKHSALAIYSPQSEQDVRNYISVLVAKGLLELKDGHYQVTPKGEKYHHMMEQALLHASQAEEEQP